MGEDGQGQKIREMRACGQHSHARGTFGEISRRSPRQAMAVQSGAALAGAARMKKSRGRVSRPKSQTHHGGTLQPTAVKSKLAKLNVIKSEQPIYWGALSGSGGTGVSWPTIWGAPRTQGSAS